MLGDAVNLASRLEGQCKTYGASIILGEATAAILREQVTLVELDLIRVKGKREPQRIFALLGGPELLEDPAVKDTIVGMNNVLTAYRCQGWDALERVLDSLETAHFSRLEIAASIELYRDRASDFRKNPPPAGWDGVYTAVTK